MTTYSVHNCTSKSSHHTVGTLSQRAAVFVSLSSEISSLILVLSLMWFRWLSGWWGVLGRWCAPLHAAALQTRQRRLRRSFQNALLSQRRQPVQPKLWWVEWDGSKHTEYLTKHQGSHVHSNIVCECVWWVITCQVSCAYRWGAPGTPSETSRVHSLVIWSGHRAETRQHRQTGAQLLCAHGGSERRQVDWSSLLPLHITALRLKYCTVLFNCAKKIFRLYFICNCYNCILRTLYFN